MCITTETSCKPRHQKPYFKVPEMIYYQTFEVKIGLSFHFSSKHCSNFSGTIDLLLMDFAPKLSA